jgi:hypothetical protein
MSEQSHIEREHAELLAAIQNIYAYCGQYTYSKISRGEFLNWVAMECERVLYGKENARKP